MSKLMYLYGIIPNHDQNEAHLPSFKGLDDQHDVYVLSYGDIAAVVCKLDEHEYGEDQIHQKTNQMEWVQEKAYHHHEVLLTIREHFTVIPMKFCTIYSNKTSLEQMLQNQHDNLVKQLSRLENREEWNLKIYCDSDKLKEQVEAHNSNIETKKEEISQMSPGRQYLEKRKLDKLINEEVEKEQQTFCSTLHHELEGFCKDSTVKKNWNKDVTGKTEEMCWNSAYLLSVDNVEAALEKITEMKFKAAQDGWQIEATGPWPAYHFANLS